MTGLLVVVAAIGVLLLAGGLLSLAAAMVDPASFRRDWAFFWAVPSGVALLLLALVVAVFRWATA